jgi:hypothetical protein
MSYSVRSLPCVMADRDIITSTYDDSIDVTWLFLTCASTLSFHVPLQLVVPLYLLPGQRRLLRIRASTMMHSLLSIFSLFEFTFAVMLLDCSYPSPDSLAASPFFA